MPEVKTKRHVISTKVAFGDVVQLARERSAHPARDGLDRFVGLEHLDSGDLRIRRWGNVSDGVTFTNVFRPGQVLFGKRRAYQRKVAIAEFSGVCSGDIYVLEAKGGALLPELLPFICQTDAFFKHAVGTSAGSLSPRTNWESLASFELVLPSIEEQARIASLLEALQSTSDAYFTLIDKARGLRRATLNWFFGPGIDCKAALQDEQPLALRCAERVVKIAEIASVVRGSTPRPAGDPRYFNGTDVPWITVGDLTKDDWLILEQTETKLTSEGATRSRFLRANTVVLTNSGFSLGVPKILGIDGCTNDGVAAFLELDSKVDPVFLYYFLAGRTKYFREVVAAGGDQPNLNTSRIGDVRIPIPSLAYQGEIANVLRDIDRQLRDSVARHGQSNKLRQNLLQSALGPAG